MSDEVIIEIKIDRIDYGHLSAVTHGHAHAQVKEWLLLTQVATDDQGTIDLLQVINRLT